MERESKNKCLSKLQLPFTGELNWLRSEKNRAFALVKTVITATRKDLLANARQLISVLCKEVKQ